MTTPLKVRIGAVIWCLYVWFEVPGTSHAAWAPALLLLAALVLVPMAWCLARDPADTGWVLALRQAAMRLQLPAAMLLVGSFLLMPGPLSALCALPWALLLGAMAVVGVKRVLQRRLVPLPELTRDAGLIYALVGGVWVLADRSGIHPLGFDEVIVILTAVHFHYAGLVLPVVTGLALRRAPASRLYRLGAWGVIVGVPLVAVGMTVSHEGAGFAVETIAAGLLVVAGWIVARLHLALAAGDPDAGRVVRILWTVSACSLFSGMLLAALYALRVWNLGWAWLDIPQMRALHGTLNSLGFALPALLAWCRAGRMRGFEA